MAVLDHWHPVWECKRLNKKPRSVVVDGLPLVLFRTQNGRASALEDRCPHRRMRLSEGRVEGERLICPYHGWRFAPSGEGESPGTPRLKPCARSFEVVERYGMIWIREGSRPARFPHFDVDGMRHISTFRRRISAPLELVLDNFTEVEHTARVHDLLGYEETRLVDVLTRLESRPDRVRVYNEGPQKPIPGVVAMLFGIHTGDLFVDDWTTHFSPVYSVYDQYWLSPSDRAPIGDRLRIYVFFTPIDAHHTELCTFAYVYGGPSRSAVIWPLQRALANLLVRRELALDVRLLTMLADHEVGIRGMQLGRFDKVLGENRRRIEGLYRGSAAPQVDGALQPSPAAETKPCPAQAQSAPVTSPV